LEILVDNISEPVEIAGSILAHVMRLGAVDVRVGGFDGLIWARIISPSGYTDVLFQAHKNLPEFPAVAESG
jgi:hypothetical protein